MGADALWVDGTLPTGVNEVRGRVMGSDLHVLVVGGSAELADRARARLEQLEARWSRFLPDSELSRLNSHGGGWVTVSSDTWLLVVAMVAAWQLTGGRCDASVLAAIVAAGYDQPLSLLPPDRTGSDLAGGAAPAGRATPGLAAVMFDEPGSRIRLPDGVGLDPGAIGKGLAADLVIADLLEAGAAGALVNVGGDVVVAGEPVDGAAWSLQLVPSEGPPARWSLHAGAVATSSSRRRRWRVDGELRHHLIDPATGTPLPQPPTTISAVAGDGWWAEAAATAIAVGGSNWARTWAPAHDVTGLMEEDDGTRHLLPGAERYLR